MPYIAAWQQPPVRGRAARAEFALHLQVLPVGRGPGEVEFLAVQVPADLLVTGAAPVDDHRGYEEIPFPGLYDPMTAGD